jgi:hypothetical protein
MADGSQNGSALLVMTGLPLLAEIFAAVLLAVALRLGWLKLRFIRRGYRAGLLGRDNVVYEERGVADTTRRVVFHGEMLVRGPHVLYMPDDLEWNDSTPVWLHGRRQQVLDRIVEDLGRVTVEAVSPSRPQNNKMQQTRPG